MENRKSLKNLTSYLFLELFCLFYFIGYSSETTESETVSQGGGWEKGTTVTCCWLGHRKQAHYREVILKQWLQAAESVNQTLPSPQFSLLMFFLVHGPRHVANLLCPDALHETPETIFLL